MLRFFVFDEEDARLSNEKLLADKANRWISAADADDAANIYSNWWAGGSLAIVEERDYLCWVLPAEVACSIYVDTPDADLVFQLKKAAVVYRAVQHWTAERWNNGGNDNG